MLGDQGQVIMKTVIFSFLFLDLSCIQ